MSQKVYFIGIAGKTMGALAKAFKDMGWEVSGSDQEKVYPPITTYLEKNHLKFHRGYMAKNVPREVDLIIVGRSALMIDPRNPEYLEAQTRGCPVLSHPEALQKYLVKKNSIVVAGTYGKTTISALIAWIMIKAGLNPSYMTGGVSLDLKDGVKITDSGYSVVEGDEPPALKETDPPKFMFYDPKYLLLTATRHDHPEIYKTPAEYLEAFVKLVGRLPADGLLVYNRENVDPRSVESFSGQKISYSLKDARADYYVREIKIKEKKTAFKVIGRGKEFNLATILWGKHNLENICGAVALTDQLGLDQTKISEAVGTFKGVKTRLEFLGEPGGRRIYWDFAQHPAKVKGSLEAIREHYPENQIFCVFDPAMTGLKHRESLKWYPGAFDSADRVIVGKVKFLSEIPKEERVTGSDIVSAIARTQKSVFYQPQDGKMIDYLANQSKKDDVIVFMSSGGLRFANLIDKVKECLAKEEM